MEISELFGREGINPTRYYAWRKALLSGAALLFHGEKDKADIKLQRLEQVRGRARIYILPNAFDRVQCHFEIPFSTEYRMSSAVFVKFSFSSTRAR